MWKGYGQFCPISKAAEVLCERWSVLVIRELMYGSRRFNDIARGVALMSRGLLAQRLRQLEQAGILRKDGMLYTLTAAGEALRPIVEQMGLWAQHFGNFGLPEHDLDDAFLIWSLRRMLKVPEERGRTVLRFDFFNLPRAARVARRSWWLVAEAAEVEVCFKDPGYEVEAVVAADLKAFTEVLLGQRSLKSATRGGDIKVSGVPATVRALPRWLPLNGETRETLNIVKPH